MRLACRLVLLLCLAWGAAAQEGSKQRVVKGPVVTDVQTDRATITWVTHKTAGQARAEGGATELALEEPMYHEVVLRGLEPGKRYTYDLRNYGADATGSFVTPPAGDEPFVFAVLGDTRTRH